MERLTRGSPRHAATSRDSAESTGGSASGSSDTSDHPVTNPAGRLPTHEGWAKAGHTHDAPQMPRWVRYLAWTMVALTALTIVLVVLVGRTEGRLDDLEGRFEAVCEVLANLPGDNANARALRDRLDCTAST
jgi:hypothetical protein